MPIDKQISPIEMRDLIKQNPEIYALDLRSQEDFKQFALPNFENLPYAEISKTIPEIEGKKIVYLICEDGNLSTKAQSLFEACGMDSFVVRGGLRAWKTIIDPTI